MLPPIHRREFVPCWYELSWQLKPLPEILIRVHRDFVAASDPLLAWSPIVEDLREAFDLEPFSQRVECNGYFGFGSNPNLITQRGDFLEFAFPVPDCQSEPGTICQSCRWSGKKSECEECGGTGNEILVSQDLAFQVAAPLHLLFSWLRYPEKGTSSTEPQLMSLSTALIKEQCGGVSVNGEFSPTMGRYLQALGEDAQMPAVIAAAKAAYYRMSGRRSYLEGLFEAFAWGGGRFKIDLPGNALGICTDSSAFKPGEGQKLASHNMDYSPVYQLAILAGLGALHDEARRWLHAMRGV